MKYWLLILSAGLLVGFFESSFWNMEQAEKVWGTAPFTPEKFKAANPADRAPMALDMIKRGLYVGDKFQRVEKLLGKPDAQMDQHRYPAYKIGGGKTDSAILVFLPDYTESRVEELRIAKTETPKPAEGSSVGVKLLPIEINGESAKAIYEQMTAIKDDQGKKVGKNITCQQNPHYRCSFLVDDHGQTTAH